MSDITREILLYEKPVGSLSRRGPLTIFQFYPSYRESPKRSVLGQQFEEDLTKIWRQHARVPVWFSNLLPEAGPMLNFVADQLGESPRKESAFLFALGEDLPGALSVGAEVENHFPQELKPADEEPTRETDSVVRFSVAGVQLKLSMLNVDNGLRLAGKGELGGCYVKFPGEFSAMTENEFAMMNLAKACGVQTAMCRLMSGKDVGELPRGFGRFRHESVYVVDRFDRAGNERIHIEDFNQVIGQWPDRKYKGASYESLGVLVNRLCGSEDFKEFVRRVVFNLAIGNEDAHLKNWSLIYPDRRNPRLSPAYDIVSTVMYPELSRDTGLRIGGKHDARRVNLHTIERLCEKAGQPTAIASDVVEQVAHQYRAIISDHKATAKLSKEHWESLTAYQASLDLFKPFAGLREI
jgi:serine/threonine-protein kinase HipA